MSPFVIPVLVGKGVLVFFNYVHSFIYLFLFPCTPALVLVMGKDGVHGGKLNKQAYTMAEYLRKSGY